MPFKGNQIRGTSIKLLSREISKGPRNGDEGARIRGEAGGPTKRREHGTARGDAKRMSEGDE